MPEFTAWNNFYVAIASVAGALIGLQFVALSLINQRSRRPQPAVGATFATPTIVHFGSVLFVAGLMLAPWRMENSPAIVLALAGLAGFCYEVFITHMIRRQNLYEPAFEDWLFHCILPIFAYLTLGVSAISSFWHVHEALFGVAGSVFLFLLIGIHNVWDAVTWHLFHHQDVGEMETTQDSATDQEL